MPDRAFGLPPLGAFDDSKEVNRVADGSVQDVALGPIQNWTASGSGRFGIAERGTSPRKPLVPE